MVGSSPQSTLFEGYEMFDDTSSYMNDIVYSSIHIYSINLVIKVSADV